MAGRTEFFEMIEVLRGNSPTAHSVAEWSQLATHKDHVFKGPIEFWNGAKIENGLKVKHHSSIGSQNHAKHSAASVGYWQWLAELAEFELQNGVGCCREHGSLNFYWGGPLASYMTALELARRAQNTRSVEVLSTCLKAALTIDALAAVAGAGPLRECWLRWPIAKDVRPHLAGAKAHLQQVKFIDGDKAIREGKAARPILDKLDHFRGVYVASAGMRIQIDQSTRDATYTARDWMLSWALNWPGRTATPAGGPDRDQISKGALASYKQVPAELAGTTSFRQTTAAEIWGLTDADRELLRRVVGGERTAIVEAVDWLNRGYRPAGGGQRPIACAYLQFNGGTPNHNRRQQIRIRRFAGNRVEMFVQRFVNGNKAGMNYARIGDGIRVIAAGVRHTNGNGANQGGAAELDLENRMVYLSGTDFGQHPVGSDRFGGDYALRTHAGDAEIDLLLTSEGVEVLSETLGNGDGGVSGRHPEHDETIASIAALMGRYPPASADSETLAAAGEAINRHGGRRGNQPIPRGGVGAATDQALRAAASHAGRIVRSSPPDRHPEHDQTIASIGALMQRYSQGSADHKTLAAFGEAINRHGGRSGSQPIPRGEVGGLTARALRAAAVDAVGITR